MPLSRQGGDEVAQLAVRLVGHLDHDVRADAEPNRVQFAAEPAGQELAPGLAKAGVQPAADDLSRRIATLQRPRPIDVRLRLILSVEVAHHRAEQLFLVVEMIVERTPAHAAQLRQLSHRRLGVTVRQEGGVRLLDDPGGRGAEGRLHHPLWSPAAKPDRLVLLSRMLACAPDGHNMALLLTCVRNENLSLLNLTFDEKDRSLILR